jgi:hypothetical protein
MQESVSNALRQGLEQMGQIDGAVVKALTETTPEELAAGFKDVLTEQLREVLEDETGLRKRQVKIQLVFLLDRFSEKLQDLLKMGVIQKGSDLMRKIDRAHFFATRIASIKDTDGSSALIKEYDQSVIPISMLDPKSSEEKADRRAAVQTDYADFLKRMGR